MHSSEEDPWVIKWEPPSFDPPKPPKPPKVAPIEYPTLEEVEAIRQKAYEEAHEIGMNHGFVEGRDAGYQEGKESGFHEGYQAGYTQANNETQQLHEGLRGILQTIEGIPEAIEASLTDLAFDIGTRLAANISMDRFSFVAAVQEALMRLPKPGETLFLRLAAQDVETWNAIIEDPGLPFSCSVLVDADTQPGHAFVEVGGARLDIGEEARVALVKSALGLLDEDYSLPLPNEDVQ
jgi:flagellar biosynthesis/type III secretory pathway protein FliH